MSLVTRALYERLAGDYELTSLLSSYNGSPAIFTVDPPPGDAVLPYIVSAGEVAQAPFDTKTDQGRDLRRDVRCYTEADDDGMTIEAIAERVRALLHRQPLAVDGFGIFIAECQGPIAADEEDAYGRIVSVRMVGLEVD